VLSALLTIAWVFVMTLAPPIPAGTDAAAELKFISDHDGWQVAGTILVLPVSLLQVPVWVALASLFWQRRPTAALISVALGLLYAPLALWTYWTQVPVIRGLTDLARVAPQDAATAYHILKFPGSLWSLTYATDVLGYALWGLAALGTFTGLFALRDRLALITGSLFGLGAVLSLVGAAGFLIRDSRLEFGIMGAGILFILAVVSAAALLRGDGSAQELSLEPEAPGGSGGQPRTVQASRGGAEGG
jgi:hypothetical protein